MGGADVGLGQAGARLREIGDDRIVYDVHWFGSTHESCSVELPATPDRARFDAVLAGVPHQLVVRVLVTVWRLRESTGRWPLTASWAG